MKLHALYGFLPFIFFLYIPSFLWAYLLQMQVFYTYKYITNFPLKNTRGKKSAQSNNFFAKLVFLDKT